MREKAHLRLLGFNCSSINWFGHNINLVRTLVLIESLPLDKPTLDEPVRWEGKPTWRAVGGGLKMTNAYIPLIQKFYCWEHFLEILASRCKNVCTRLFMARLFVTAKPRCFSAVISSFINPFSEYLLGA